MAFLIFGLLLGGGLLMSIIDSGEDAVESADPSDEAPAEDPVTSDPGSLLDPPPTSTPSETPNLDIDGRSIAGTSGDDTLGGGPNADFLTGGDGDDLLRGFGDSDELLGQAGDDTLFGGEDGDSLNGGAGADVLFGGDESDVLLGGDGNDRLVGGEEADVLGGEQGRDTLEGGNGNDVILAVELELGSTDAEAAEAGDSIEGGFGSDLILVGAFDSVNGGAGADTVVTGTFVEQDRAAVFSDYDADEDVIEVRWVEAEEDEPTVTIDVDGDDSLLRLNGNIVLRVTGVTDLTADDVVLTAI